MEKFGASAEQIAELKAYYAQRVEQRECEVWPQHWHALRVFLRLSTQWRVAVGDRFLWLGLDYNAIPLVEQRTAPALGAPAPDPATLFEQLRTLERAALEVLNARR